MRKKQWVTFCAIVLAVCALCIAPLWYVVLPWAETNSILKAFAYGEDRNKERVVKELGGGDVAYSKLRMYLRVPWSSAKHKRIALFIISTYGARSVPVLLDGLRDRSVAVRKVAISRLIALGEDAYEVGVPGAVDHLDEVDDDVRDRICYFVGSGGAVAKPFKKKVVASLYNTEPGVRNTTLALVRFMGEHALDLREDVVRLTKDGDENVRIQARATLEAMEEIAEAKKAVGHQRTQDGEDGPKPEK